MSLLNPLSIAFWVAMSSRADQLQVTPIAFLLGFLAGVLIVAVTIAVMSSCWMHKVQVQWLQGIVTGCGVMLIGFGLKMAYVFVLSP